MVKEEQIVIILNENPTLTWNGENLDEFQKTFGLGIIQEKSGSSLWVRVPSGKTIHVQPGDTVRSVRGEIEVYSCLIFHPVFRMWPA